MIGAGPNLVAVVGGVAGRVITFFLKDRVIKQQQQQKSGLLFTQTGSSSSRPVF